MKKLILSSLLLSSGLTLAADKLVCEQLEGWETQGYTVLMKYTADINKKSPLEVELKNLNLKYNIEGETLDDPENWGMGNHDITSVTNKEDYNPRKYKGHMKFELSLNSRTSYGSVDLIIPSKHLIRSRNSKFNAYAIMTSIEDHMGGTVKLDCTIEAEDTSFSQTTNILDKLILNNEDTEGMLSYRRPDIQGYENDLSKIMTDLMVNSMFNGVSELKLEEVIRSESEVDTSVEKILNELNFKYSPLFCEKLVNGFWDYPTSKAAIKECRSKTKIIVKNMLTDESMDDVSILVASGSEWGSWESVYLIGRNFDTEESIIVFFDIIHEI